MANEKTTMSNQTKSSELTLDDAIKWAQEWQESSELAIPAEIVTGLVEGAIALKGRNATQEESITHMQSQFRVMKEAIERTITFMRRWFGEHSSRKLPGDEELMTLLETAITPKGSEQ